MKENLPTCDEFCGRLPEDVCVLVLGLRDYVTLPGKKN